MMNMKKTVAIFLIALTAGTAARAAQIIVENQRGPEIPLTLQNGVTTVITEVHLPCRGKWTISGGATVQMNATPSSGSFLYTAAAFTVYEDQFPVDGRTSLDARPFGTWWFPAEPRTHTITVDYDGADVYLLVLYYGQVPADFVQAFGSIIATIDLD